jgi:hypothetical protein
MRALRSAFDEDEGMVDVSSFGGETLVPVSHPISTGRFEDLDRLPGKNPVRRDRWGD